MAQDFSSVAADSFTSMSDAEAYQQWLSQQGVPDSPEAQAAFLAAYPQASLPGASAEKTTTTATTTTTAPKPSVTDLLVYDSAKVNAKVLDRFTNTPNDKRDSYKDATFIKGAKTAAERKAYAIKLANMTTTGKSATDQAAIKQARQWYTGQTKGGKKAGWTDKSLKSIRRGKDDKGKVVAKKAITKKPPSPPLGSGTLTAAQKREKAATAATNKNRGEIKKPNPSPRPKSDPKPSPRPPAGRDGRVSVGSEPSPRSSSPKTTKQGKFTPGQTPGIPTKVKPKPPKMKKTSDSWKQQRQPKRTTRLESATAQIAADERGDAAKRANRKENPKRRDGKTDATMGMPGWTIQTDAAKKAAEAAAKFLSAPGSIPQPRTGVAVANQLAIPTRARQTSDIAATTAALAAHGYSETPKKPPTKSKTGQKNKSGQNKYNPGR